jgi:plastocyanin
MKTVNHFIRNAFFFSCMFLFAFNSYAAVHVILANDGTLTFEPGSLNVMVGDTIVWEWTSGFHTTTSLTIPGGAASWDAPLTSADPNFVYVVGVAGTYNYKCTPHESMGMTGSFIAHPNTPLSVAPGSVGLRCFGDCNASAIVFVSGGVPPYLFAWSDGATGPTIDNLCAGTYGLTVTDMIGNTDSVFITIAEPTLITITASITDASCGICDGEIDVTAAGGTPPYNMEIIPGDTGQHFSGLCPGIYEVWVIDGYNCISSDVAIVQGVAACFDTISGTVYHDVNGNCIQDAGDDGIPDFLVDLTPGGAVYTDSNGNYSFVRDTGMYEVNAVVQNFHNIICPPSNSYMIHLDTAGLHAGGNDFAVQIIPVQDLSASLFCGNARPGFLLSNSFSINNEGSVTMNGTAELHLDSRLTFVSANPPEDAFHVGSNTFYWNFSNLGMNQRLTVHFTVQVPAPPAVNIGDTLFNYVLVNPVAGDVDSLNNISVCENIVSGSYDPNDKAVSPQGETAEGFIAQEDTLLYYTIRFQNTGTDTAFNVVIKDTLDSDLDWRTFKQGTASHPHTVQFAEDDVVEFTFTNILLPDSHVNEPASHGYVTFYIKHDGVLPLNTVITNRAAIYFDFNLPVITNTVTNKIFEPVGVNEFHPVSNRIRLYPNPASDGVTVESRDEISLVFLSDLAGKKIYKSADVNMKTFVFSAATLPAGMYLLGVQTKGGLLETRRLAVER